ncbi:hypothetical protein ACFX19_045856 [Malus domestica]
MELAPGGFWTPVLLEADRFNIRGESSMPSNDDRKPSIGADWRSFRVKLVAAEKSRPKEPTSASSLVDLHTLVDQPNPITVGDKCAHTIHKSEKGCLLLATKKHGGVHIFERTIIWLLSTGPLGPSGIILNRPSLMSNKETRWTARDVAGTFSTGRCSSARRWRRGCSW